MGVPWTQRFDWDDARIERLKTMFAEKFTASQIASEIGTSRNAVIGKLHRLGLRRGNTVPDPVMNQPRKQRVRPAARRGQKQKHNPVSLPPLPLPEIPAVACNPVPLIDLPFAGKCKFEVSCADNPADYLFCANPTAGENLVYCADHCRIAYRA